MAVVNQPEGRNNRQAEQSFNVNEAVGTEGFMDYALSHGVEEGNFHPHTDENDKETLRQLFEAFKEEKEKERLLKIKTAELTKDVVGFLQGHFREEAGVALNPKQLDSVRSKIEQLASSDNPAEQLQFEQMIDIATRYKQSLAEVQQKEQEVRRALGGITPGQWREKLDEAIKKQRTLELALQSDPSQAEKATRRKEEMDSRLGEREAKRKFGLKAFDEAVKNFRQEAVITADDRKFMEGVPDDDEVVEYFTRSTRTTALGQNFADFLNDRRRKLIEAERKKINEQAELGEKRLEAKKEAEQKYRIELGLFKRLKNRITGSGRVKNIFDELDVAKDEIEAAEAKQGQVEELVRLREDFLIRTKGLRDLFITEFAEMEEVKKAAKQAAQEKLAKMLNEGRSAMKTGATGKAEEALSYLEQLEKAGDEGGADYLKKFVYEEKGEKGRKLKYSAKKLGNLIRSGIEEEVTKMISKKIDEAVGRKKPEAVAKVILELMRQVKIGKMTPEEVGGFIGRVIAEKREGYKQGGNRAKVLAINLALDEVDKKTRLATNAA